MLNAAEFDDWVRKKSENVWALIYCNTVDRAPEKKDRLRCILVFPNMVVRDASDGATGSTMIEVRPTDTFDTLLAKAVLLID
jgi:hypothetical protein